MRLQAMGRVALVGLFCLAPAGGAALAQAEAPTVEEAQALLQAEAWSEAARAFVIIADREPDNPAAWSGLGSALFGQQSYLQAGEAWKRAEALDFRPPQTRFNLARAYAAGGNKQEALDWLEQAVEAGYSNVGRLTGATEFGGLKGEPRFQQVVARADRIARPCVYGERHSEFDFWVGEWEVLTPQGQLAGTNTIEKQLDGCLLLENWNGAGGGIGKSVNYFDPVAESWKQLWVDGRGGNILLEGRLEGGSMTLVGEHRYGDGRVELIRGIWTPLEDGRVRQYFEQSRDNGESWYTWFDGYYQRAD